MKIYPIEAGNFKLDGGAMFGVVPKALWQKTNPADENNMINIGSRCMLIEDGKRLVLIDVGMGDKQPKKFFDYYYKWGEFGLKSSIEKAGFSCDEITDVFFTHLHFDHCGGGVSGTITKLFLNFSLKMLATGLTKSIGTGQSNQTLEKKLLFWKKTFSL